MSIGLQSGQVQSQQQSLAMTPQLQQAIKILQYSNQELIDFVSGQLLENPLLEAPDLPHSNGSSYTSNAVDASQWEDKLVQQKTLRQHAEDEAGLLLDTAQEKLVALHFIDALDRNGYCRASIEDVSALTDVTIKQAVAILKKLQKMEPVGIFCRDIAECLELQLKEQKNYGTAMRRLIDNLDLLAAGDGKKLMAICGVELDILQEMIAEVRSLNPKPAADFIHEEDDIVLPDVLVMPLPNGGYHVELNSDTLPKVLVNNDYSAKLDHVNKQEKTYIKTCQNQADFIVKSLETRAENILKVALEIVTRQEAFFDKGVRYLKPMVLKDIAEATGLHESTVSRVTSNKYMLTARGTVPLKFFFTSSVAGITGEGVAATAVQDHIRQLIDNEGTRVMSDDALKAALDDKGITIARRTVSKYREAMGIGSSVERRKALKRL